VKGTTNKKTTVVFGICTRYIHQAVYTLTETDGTIAVFSGLHWGWNTSELQTVQLSHLA